MNRPVYRPLVVETDLSNINGSSQLPVSYCSSLIKKSNVDEKLLTCFLPSLKDRGLRPFCSVVSKAVPLDRKPLKISIQEELNTREDILRNQICMERRGK